MSSSNHEDWGDTSDYNTRKVGKIYIAESVERHPDKRPSSAEIHYSDDPRKDLISAMPVRGLGVLVFRATTGHPDGKMRFEGLSLFTTEEIQFDK